MAVGFGKWKSLATLTGTVLQGVGNELKEDKIGMSSGGEEVKTVAIDNFLKKFDHEGEQSSEMRMEGILHLECSF